MLAKSPNWFTRLCRDLGLTVHNIKHPDNSETRVLRKDVTEKRSGKVTLRRTTIDEVEIHDDDDQQ